MQCVVNTATSLLVPS